MQRNVHDVEADRIETPDLKLEPESRKRDWPVIDERAGHPRLEQAPGSEYRVYVQVQIIVTDERPLPRRLVDQDDGCQQGDDK